MSADSLESLPSHLRELVALESEAYPVDAAIQAEVLARVELAVQLAAPDASGGGAPKLGAGAGGAAGAAAAGLKKLVAVGVSGLLIGGGVGVLGANLFHAPAAPPPRPPAITSPSGSELPAPRDVPTSSSTPANAPTTAPTPSPRAPHAENETSHQGSSTEEPSLRGDLTKERELLDVARAALARGRPDDAIAACELHGKTWPHGYLGEEREVVLIQALVLAGRRPEAERRAAQFRKAFRQSMLLPAVDVALDGGQ